MIVPTHILPKPQDTSIMQVVTTNKRAPHAAQTVHHAWLPKYPSPDAPASSSTAATNQAPIRRAPLISPNTRIPHSPDTRTQACVTCAQQQTLISYRVSSKLLHEDGEREREREREKRRGTTPGSRLQIRAGGEQRRWTRRFQRSKAHPTACPAVRMSRPVRNSQWQISHWGGLLRRNCRHVFVLALACAPPPGVMKRNDGQL